VNNKERDGGNEETTNHKRKERKQDENVVRGKGKKKEPSVLHRAAHIAYGGDSYRDLAHF
jgi:hypothetical protein